MKYYIIIGLLLVLPSIINAQGGINNNGAKIQVSVDTEVIIISGGVINQGNGEITNAGNIYLDNDWSQIGATTTYSGTGWMWFENGINQILTSVSPIVVPNLRVDNGDLLILGSNVTVSTEVDFMNNGKIVLRTNNLLLASILWLGKRRISSYNGCQSYPR